MKDVAEYYSDSLDDYFESSSAVFLWSSVIGFQVTEAACGAHSVEALTLGGPVFLEAHTASGDAKAAQRGYIALWKGRRERAHDLAAKRLS